MNRGVVNVSSGVRFDVYIGRGTPGSPGPWGNPFVIGKDGNREQVVEKISKWFATSPAERAVWMRANIHTLTGKSLGCHCAPLACHGDILRAVANPVTLTEAPVRNCCMKRHYGVRCPDGKVMCCMCFDRFEVADLSLDGGVPIDVCKPCAAHEAAVMEKAMKTENL